MSGPRRIPISARATPGQRPTSRPHNQQQQPQAPAYPSSLDLVFSFFRSAPMPSLPSSPSFVARYRRPPGAGGGGEGDDDSSFAGTSSLAASETETDYEDEWSGEDDELDPEEVNSWDPAVGLEDGPSWTRERVPRNAVRKASSRRLGRQRDPSAESDPTQTYDQQRHLRPASESPSGRLLSPPNERTGLLAAAGRRGRSLSPQGRQGSRADSGDASEAWAGTGTISKTLQVSLLLECVCVGRHGQTS